MAADSGQQGQQQGFWRAMLAADPVTRKQKDIKARLWSKLHDGCPGQQCRQRDHQLQRSAVHCNNMLCVCLILPRNGKRAAIACIAGCNLQPLSAGLICSLSKMPMLRSRLHKPCMRMMQSCIIFYVSQCCSDACHCCHRLRSWRPGA